MTTIAIIALAIYALDRLHTGHAHRRWHALHAERFARLDAREALLMEDDQHRSERTRAAIAHLPNGMATLGEADALACLEGIRRMRDNGALDESIAALRERMEASK